MKTVPAPEKSLFAWTPWVAHHFSLTTKDAEKIENIVSGGLEFFEKHQHEIDCIRPLPSNLERMFFETSCAVTGETQRLERSSRNLETNPGKGSFNASVWAERTFLRGFALYRLGKVEKARKLWQSVLTFAPSERRSNISSRIVIEQSAVALNSGLFVAASIELKGVLDTTQDHLDKHSEMRTLSLLILSQVTSGEVNKAEAALQRRATLASQATSPIFAITQDRAQIEVLLAQGRLWDALRKSDEALLSIKRYPAYTAVMLHLRARLLIVAGKFSEAKATLEAVRERIQSQRISSALANLIEDELFLALEDESLDTMETLLGKAFAEAQERSDLVCRCTLLLLAAQLAMLRSQFENAERLLNEAQMIADVQCYVGIQIEGLLLQAVLALQNSNTLRSRDLFQAARDIAAEKQLRHFVVQIEGVASILAREVDWLQKTAKWISMQNEQGLPILPYLLRKVLHHHHVQTSSQNEQRILSISSFFDLFSRHSAVIFSPRENRLLLWRRQRFACMEFNNGLKRDKVAIELLSHVKGLSIEDVHGVLSSTQFHPLRHGERVRSCIHEVRSLLRPMRVEIEYDKTTQRYRTFCGAQFLLVELVQNVRAKSRRRRRPSHLESLRELFACHEKMLSQDLSKKMQMSRQALRPYLKELLQKGEIDLVKRGPRSYYRHKRR